MNTKITYPWIACLLLAAGVGACGAPSTGDDSTDSDPPASTSPTTEDPPDDPTDGTEPDTDTDDGQDTDDGIDTDGETDTEGTEPVPPDEELFACMLDEPCPPIDISYGDCEIDGTCDDPVDLSPAQICRLELALAATSGGLTGELNREEAGSPAYLDLYVTNVFRDDATVLHQTFMVDHELETTQLFPVRQCSLAPAEYFQGCLDDPRLSCVYEHLWVVDCVDVESFACEG